MLFRSLLKKIDEQDCLIKQLKHEKKLLIKSHTEEMRGRDKSEFAAVIVLCGVVMLYACLALLVSGFV